MKISKIVPVVAVLIAVAGCSAPSPADRAKELDRMYAEGQAAQGRMDKTGQVISETTCAAMFVATGLSEYVETNAGGNVEPPEGFRDQRYAYYLNGCLGNGKGEAITPSVTPPAVTKSAG